MTAGALVMSVVDTCTEELHLIPIEAAALHRRSGRYPALCGAVVPAASLLTAPARHCPKCAKQARERGGSGALRRKPGRGGARIPWSRVLWFRREGRHRERRG